MRSYEHIIIFTRNKFHARFAWHLNGATFLGAFGRGTEAPDGGAQQISMNFHSV